MFSQPRPAPRAGIIRYKHSALFSQTRAAAVVEPLSSSMGKTLEHLALTMSPVPSEIIAKEIPELFSA